MSYTPGAMTATCTIHPCSDTFSPCQNVVKPGSQHLIACTHAIAIQSPLLGHPSAKAKLPATSTKELIACTHSHCNTCRILLLLVQHERQTTFSSISEQSRRQLLHEFLLGVSPENQPCNLDNLPFLLSWRSLALPCLSVHSPWFYSMT